MLWLLILNAISHVWEGTKKFLPFIHVAMKNKSILILLIAMVFLSSCRALFETFVGIHQMDQFDSDKYETFIGRLPNDIPFTSVIGTAEQSLEVMKFDTTEWYMHKLYQPIQLLYFHGNELVSYHVNCTAPARGLGLNWNYDQRFESFPPKSPLNCDSTSITLDQYTDVYPEIYGNGKYTLIVFWSNILEKVSRSAIVTAFKNLKKFGQVSNCDVFLINDDLFLIEMMKNEGQTE